MGFHATSACIIVHIHISAQDIPLTSIATRIPSSGYYTNTEGDASPLCVKRICVLWWKERITLGTLLFGSGCVCGRVEAREV